MQESRPDLVALHPMAPVTRTSVIVAPVAVANLAIRDIMEANAPRGLNGKNDNPLADLLGKADIGWNIGRGPIAVTGTNGSLNISTTLNGSLRVTGQVANQGGNIAGAITGILGDSLGRNVGQLAGRVLDQRADIRGNVFVTSRPQLTPSWRIEPNLSGSVSIGDGGMQIAGIKLNVSDQVKPLLDKTVNEQIGNLSAKAARRPHAGEHGAQAVDPDVPRDPARPAHRQRAGAVARGAADQGASRRSRASCRTG